MHFNQMLEALNFIRNMHGIVADSSKLGRRGFAKIGDLDLVTDLITDSAASPDAVAALQRAGIRVHLVDAS